MARSRLHVTAGIGLAALSVGHARADIDWLAPHPPEVSEVTLIDGVGAEPVIERGAAPFVPSNRPIVYFPMASSGKNCSNPYGFPLWRSEWQPNRRDVAGRPNALTGIFNRVNTAWDQGYRRFLFHRFGGDQGGGSYSAAQWWTFSAERRWWYMRDDDDPETGVPMGLTAFIAQKKAEDPTAEFYIYLGFILLKVDSLIQDEPPFTLTNAYYSTCDPRGEDPLDLIPEDIGSYTSRTMCLNNDDDIGRSNQLWLTLGAFIEMGFDGAYFDALGAGRGNGALCAAELATLPQYAQRGFTMGVEPIPTRRENRVDLPIDHTHRQAPSMSNYRYVSHRMDLNNDGLGNPDWDLRGTGAESAVVLRHHDWADDTGFGSAPPPYELNIQRFYQLVRHGYTPMAFEWKPETTNEAMALIMDFGEPTCRADITFDGIVDSEDVVLFIQHFLDPPEPVRGKLGLYHADYHDDDLLDINDVDSFIDAYLRGCNG